VHLSGSQGVKQQLYFQVAQESCGSTRWPNQGRSNHNELEKKKQEKNKKTSRVNVKPQQCSNVHLPKALLGTPVQFLINAII